MSYLIVLYYKKKVKNIQYAKSKSIVAYAWLKPSTTQEQL